MNTMQYTIYIYIFFFFLERDCVYLDAEVFMTPSKRRRFRRGVSQASAEKIHCATVDPPYTQNTQAA